VADLQVLSYLEQQVQTVTGQGAHFLREPELTLWFDLPPETAALRLAGARVPDKFEAQPAEFFRRVAAGYAQRMDESPQRFARIDANQSIDQVRLDVFAAARARGLLA